MRNKSGVFKLEKNELAQYEYGEKFRGASRKTVASAFRKSGKTVAISGRHDLKFFIYNMWYGVVLNGRLHIGCVMFTRLQTKIIRKWALA